MVPLSSKPLEFMNICKNVIQAGEVKCASQGWESLSLFTDTFHAACEIVFSQWLFCLKVKILANETHEKNTCTLILPICVSTMIVPFTTRIHTASQTRKYLECLSYTQENGFLFKVLIKQLTNASLSFITGIMLSSVCLCNHERS